MSTGKLARRFERPADTLSLECATFSPDGKALALAVRARDTSSTRAATVSLRDLTTGKETRRFEAPPGRIRAVAFAPDGKTVAAVHDGGSLYLWETGTGKELARLRAGEEKITRVAYAPDGKHLAADAGNQVHVWDAGTRKPIHSFDEEEGFVVSAALSLDGKTLATGEVKTVRLRDAATGKPFRVFRGHEGRVGSVAFSPGGKLLASAGDDGTTRLWEASTGREVRKFSGAGGHVTFSPDGKLVASGTRVVYLWEAATGKEVRRCEEREDNRWLRFSPDSKSLVVGCDSTSSFLFEIATGRKTTASTKRFPMPFSLTMRRYVSGPRPRGVSARTSRRFSNQGIR